MVDLQSFKDNKVQLITFRPMDKGKDSYRDLLWMLEDVVEKLNDEESTVVVLLDMSWSNLNSQLEYDDREGHSISDLISDIKFPTIGIVESGADLTILELFLCCDIRVANEESTFSMSHVLEGYTPTDGGTQRLPRIAGIGRAMDLLLTGRSFAAQEALEIGVVQYLFSGDVIGRAIELGCQIADHGPIAARYLKEAILDGSDMTLNQGLRLETDLNIILQSTYDRAEGIGSFLNKKRPKYEGR
ncbi:enoyl-CoA hydratase-related protein [Chloroflexi bacterium]|nr:enoyl-CoA hydratase-related protein [Chloroflexota bacterium]